MALKPTGDDVGVLAAMALVLLAGAAYVIASYRGIELGPTGQAAARRA